MLIMPVQIRFADTDALGHVNNAAFASYAELGRLALFERSGRGVGSLILARLAIDFRRQVRIGQRVEVESGVARIGRSSIALVQRVTADGETAADVDSVVVWYDYGTQRPAPVPDDVRDALLTAPAGSDAVG